MPGPFAIPPTAVQVLSSSRHREESRPPVRGPALLPVFVHPAPSARPGPGGLSRERCHICPPGETRRVFANYRSGHLPHRLKREVSQPNEKQARREKPKARAQGPHPHPRVRARPGPAPSRRGKPRPAGGAGARCVAGSPEDAARGPAANCLSWRSCGPRNPSSNLWSRQIPPSIT